MDLPSVLWTGAISIHVAVYRPPVSLDPGDENSHTGSVELSARARERRASERCPYCHDILADTRLAEVECPGCGTTHHVVCIQQLGRCTIHGCEEAIVVPEPDRSWEDSPELRKVRRRLRDRVRQFVGTHAKNRRERILDAVERAKAFEEEKRYGAAADANDDLAYLEPLPEIRSDSTLEDVPGRLSLGEARYKAREMRSQQNSQFARYVVLVLGGVIGLPALLWAVIVLALKLAE